MAEKKKRAAMLPWERYPAEWTTKALWPRLVFGATQKVAAGSHVLDPAGRHHLMLFRSSVFINVRNAGTQLERSLRVGAGDVMLRPAGLPAQDHSWHADEGFQLVHAVILDPTVAPAPSYLLPVPTVYKIHDPLIGLLIDKLYDASVAELAGTHRVVDSASELLCLHFPESLATATAAEGSGALPADVLGTVCAHIEDNLDQPIRVGTLAELADLSPSHFVRAFKAATGLTPTRFLFGRRALLAERLLSASEKSLAEIAHVTGFGSQSQFTTAFRKLVGKTPAEFRKSAR